MANNSSIEWTEATWNPVSGCTRVSAGCDICYAVFMTKRLASMGQDKYKGLVNPGRGHFNGIVKEHPDALTIPLKRRKGTLYFVNSMSDLFHSTVSTEFIQRVFAVMEQTPRHKYQVLTKRPERLVELNGALPWPDNVWVGTSVEDKRVTDRIGHLQGTRARIKFLSLEPLLGPLPDLDLDGIDWVIVGGESGSGARPMKEQWVRQIHEQCKAADVAFFFKQLGSIWASNIHASTKKGGDLHDLPKSLRIRKFPKVLAT